MLGGAYANRTSDATAFYFRDKIWVFYYTFAIPPAYRMQMSPKQYKLGKKYANDLLR